MASAMSATYSSSKHSTRVSRAMARAICIERLSAAARSRRSCRCTSCMKRWKVAPAPLGERQAVEEQIHEPGLAAADAAPQVQSAHRSPRRTGAEDAEPARQARAPRRLRAGAGADPRVARALRAAPGRIAGDVPRARAGSGRADRRPRARARRRKAALRRASLRTRLQDCKLGQIAEILERTRIGERIHVVHRQPVDDVAHRKLGELAGERARQVRHRDDLAPARAARWSGCGWCCGSPCSAPHRAATPRAAARTAPRARHPASPGRPPALRQSAAGSRPRSRSPRYRCARRRD